MPVLIHFWTVLIHLLVECVSFSFIYKRGSWILHSLSFCMFHIVSCFWFTITHLVESSYVPCSFPQSFMDIVPPSSCIKCCRMLIALCPLPGGLPPVSVNYFLFLDTRDLFLLLWSITDSSRHVSELSILYRFFPEPSVSLAISWHSSFFLFQILVNNFSI